MDGLTLLGIVTVLFLMVVIALCKVAARADEEAAHAERFVMQSEAFNWPSREEA